jgi:hypothetical protein
VAEPLRGGILQAGAYAARLNETRGDGGVVMPLGTPDHRQKVSHTVLGSTLQHGTMDVAARPAVPATRRGTPALRRQQATVFAWRWTTPLPAARPWAASAGEFMLLRCRRSWQVRSLEQGMTTR